MKNIISGQNGVFVIFNKRRNRIGKPLMRGNFENTRPSIIKRHLSYLDWYFEFYPYKRLTYAVSDIVHFDECVNLTTYWPLMNFHYVSLRIVQHFWILLWTVPCCIKPFFFQLLIIWICLSFNRSICIAFYQTDWALLFYIINIINVSIYL